MMKVQPPVLSSQQPQCRLLNHPKVDHRQYCFLHLDDLLRCKLLRRYVGIVSRVILPIVLFGAFTKLICNFDACSANQLQIRLRLWLSLLLKVAIEQTD